MQGTEEVGNVEFCNNLPVVVYLDPVPLLQLDEEALPRHAVAVVVVVVLVVQGAHLHRKV